MTRSPEEALVPGSASVAQSRSVAGPVEGWLWLPVEARLVIFALCFRTAATFVGFIANVVIPDYRDQGFTVLAQPNPFWDRFARWDAGWYYGIAANGYAYVEGGRSNLAFFPAYPKLMGVLGRVLGGEQHDFYFAGILISWLSFAAALPLVYRLAAKDLTHEQALRAAAYTAVFPSAYFFGVVYSEALFLLALVGAALAMRSRQWVWAAIAAAIMTATRVNGVMFLPALGLIGWDAARSPRDRTCALAAACVGVTGIATYSAYVYTLSGNPFEWYASITRWGYHPGGNPLAGLFAIFEALFTRPMQFIATERMAPYDTINALIATAALLSVPFIWHRLGRGYAAIVVLGLLLPLSSGQYEGLARYCSVLFPLPILLGSLKGEARHLGLLASFVLIYALGLVLFAKGHPLI